MLNKQVSKVSKLVSLLLIFAIVFSGCGGTEVERYFNQYAKQVDFEQGLDDKTFGKADGYRFFFAGEIHQQTMIYPAKKMMLQYLHENQGVNYLLMEEGVGAGLLIDHYIQEFSGKVDYVHGENIVRQLAAQVDNIGILFPSIPKQSLFETVLIDGTLPRKTFSMGQASDKRFYLECRKIKP